jgi:hypothetical protein
MKERLINISKTVLFILLSIVIVPILTMLNETICFMASNHRFKELSNTGAFLFIFCCYIVFILFYFAKVITYKLLKLIPYNKFGKWFFFVLFSVITLAILIDAYKEHNLEKTRDFIGILLYLVFSYTLGQSIYEGLNMDNETYIKFTKTSK